MANIERLCEQFNQSTGLISRIIFSPSSNAYVLCGTNSFVSPTFLLSLDSTLSPRWVYELHSEIPGGCLSGMTFLELSPTLNYLVTVCCKYVDNCMTFLGWDWCCTTPNSRLLRA